MAKFCTQCNQKNANNNTFCRTCGAQLPTILKSPVEEQQSAVYKITGLVLVFALLLCLLTIGLSVFGVQPYLLKHKNNVDVDGIEAYLEAYSFRNSATTGDSTIIYSNIYQTIYSMSNMSSDVIRDEIFMLEFLSIISNFFYCICYIVLALMLIVPLVKVCKKSKKMKSSLMLPGITGLILILSGLLFNWLFIRYFDISSQTTYHAFPQPTTILALPLFMQMPLLAHLFPGKKKIKRVPQPRR